MKFRACTVVLAAALMTLSFVACTDRSTPSGGNDQRQGNPAAQNLDKDTSTAPGSDQDQAMPEGARGSSFNIRSNTIRTRHIFDGAVTAGKLAIVAVTVNVAAAGTTGSSAADPSLVGGFLISCDPSGNQDQHLDNAVLNGDGSITATLGAAATAQNNFRCVVVKANAKGIS
jgi:hypothetical protein